MKSINLYNNKNQWKKINIDKLIREFKLMTHYYEYDNKVLNNLINFNREDFKYKNNITETVKYDCSKVALEYINKYKSIIEP